MIHRALSKTACAVSNTYGSPFSGVEFDKIMIGFRQTHHATDKVSWSDLLLLQIEITLEHNTLGKVQLISSNAQALAKWTDLHKGYSFDATDTDASDFQAIVDVGRINKEDYKSGAISVSFGAMGTISADCNLEVCLINSDDSPSPIKQYVSYTSGGDFDVTGGSELLLVEASAGDTYYITDDKGTQAVLDTTGDMLANAVSNIEAEKDITFLWADRKGIGQNIHVRTPATKKMFYVARLN